MTKTSKNKKMLCEYCRKPMKRARTILVNKGQHRSTRFFCSKSCKIKWVRNFRRRVRKGPISWKIGEYSGKYFFVKAIITTDTSDPRTTYFSERLTEVYPLIISKNRLIVAQEQI
ncbi:MAG: hypothetical protein GF383_14260 [Candidatus Lokiarchaeota archaeon]|nr:hypothetical protein [Candidatus Lokiarchaeota archaeon]MBD3342531.1 hypothetical protein [Candidatus Lokiarchaeota archaeon]